VPISPPDPLSKYCCNFATVVIRRPTFPRRRFFLCVIFLDIPVPRNNRNVSLPPRLPRFDLNTARRAMFICRKNDKSGKTCRLFLQRNRCTFCYFPFLTSVLTAFAAFFNICFLVQSPLHLQTGSVQFWQATIYLLSLFVFVITAAR
jgi:hypothetical protein